MPQFRIRRHPHGGTFLVWFLNNSNSGKWWYEGNSVDECLTIIIDYVTDNSYRNKFLLEVLPD